MTFAGELVGYSAASRRGSSENAPAARTGELIGNTYRLLGRIGSGGMGDVYAAEHCRLGRQFAVKLLRVDGQVRTVERFRREAKAIARIENEYVVSVVDCGEASDGTPYMVMDLLRGEDLRALLDRTSPLPIPRAVNLVSDACQGVAAVHRAGLVHRDLKPGNLFVTRRSTGEDWCKVLDFGVAKMDASTSTADGAVIGTVKYMAPEQLRDGASAGARVDIYALGAILYECLSGVAPHSGTSVQELMFKIMNEEPVRLEQRRREIPAALADAVMRALAKSPDERFETSGAFASAIMPFTHPSARPDFFADGDTVALEGARVGPGGKVRRTAALLFAGVTLSVAVVAIASLDAGHERDKPSILPPSPATSRAAEHAKPTVVSQDILPIAATDVSTAGPAPVSSVPVSSPQAVKKHAKTSAPSRSALPPSPRFDAENPYGR